jgi:hypothetical protein
MIKYMWKFHIDWNVFLLDVWSLYSMNHVSFRKWLKLRDMESTSNSWDHTDDFNIGKRMYFKLLNIIHVDV